MTGSVALDVVIGLVFVYLLYSLLASIIQEAVANVCGFRAKFLEKALIRMLEDGKGNAAKTFWESLGSLFEIFGKRKDYGNLHLVQTFYNYPLIKYLAEDDYHSKPSYLTAKNFAKTMIDLLRGETFSAGADPKLPIEDSLAKKQVKWVNPITKKEATINDETLSYLKALWADSQGDVSKFQLGLEQWFDDTMERTTGWYKKHIQAVLLMIGFLIAIFFNVDTLKIANRLSKDPDLRAQVVKQADNYIQAHKTELEKLGTQEADTSKNKKTDPNLMSIRKTASELLEKSNQLVAKDITEVNEVLAIGWSCKCKNRKDSICIGSNFGIGSIFGWFLTAFALSLGAPFWFDLLNKLMQLRASISSGEKEAQSSAANGKNPVINPKG